MTNPAPEPFAEGPQRSAPDAPRSGRLSPFEDLAYSCAVDLHGETPKAVNLARDLLKAVRKSGLKAPFSEALLRRLALAEWTKLDRSRPTRLESKDPKESTILLYFLNAWRASHEDLAAALSVSEDRARHLVHKARMERVGTMTRIPIPKPGCRRPRELLSDFHERRLTSEIVDEITLHLQDCRECTLLDRHLQTLLNAPLRPLLEAPPELAGPPEARPTLSLTLDGVSRGQRRAGILFLAVGVLMGAIQLHPGLNAWALAQMDRSSAGFSRWRGKAEKLMDDLRVLRALAASTVQGRTEELSQTLDEYVNSDKASETSNPKNKPEADAVLGGRDPKNMPSPQTSPRPVEGSPLPVKP